MLKISLDNKKISVISRLSLFFVFLFTSCLLFASDTTHDGQPVIRVKLGTLHKTFTLVFPSGGAMNINRNKRLKQFRNNDSFKWNLDSSANHKKKDQYSGAVTFTSSSKPIELNGKAYRGDLVVHFSSSGALIVNHVGIEDYLKGVVGSEIGSMSPFEALKVQTVIARTYAWASKGKHKSENADLCDSTHCQTYGGVAAERDSITPAIMATCSIIMVSEGKPIETLYHATCGGMTSDNDKVFGGAPRSYLRRVSCPFCTNGTNYRWTKSISIADLKKQLAPYKVSFNTLFNVDYKSKTRLDRVDEVILTTDKGIQKIKGTQFRTAFSLPSTTFAVVDKGHIKNLILSAQPSETDNESFVDPAYSVSISGISHAANQIFVMSKNGLVRAQAPSSGWQTVSCIKATKTSVVAKPLTRVATSSNQSGIEIFGRGFGHQVGLCQSGAIEMSKRGWSYRQILAYYYSNSVLRSLDY